MVAINTLSKLCVLVAFGLSATVTATDVAQEQPKKESFVRRFFGKREEPATKPVEVQRPENTETGEPAKFSVEWYLLPKPENREQLRDKLPLDVVICVPKDCNEPILPVIEKKIRDFFSLSEQEQISRRRYSYIICPH
uniref:Small open reading frame n=1 Tax=Babesia bovis TaxID=5865 RepID=S6C8E7_BABBO|nr:small open reading frame [Babesia bovis]